MISYRQLALVVALTALAGIAHSAQPSVTAQTPGAAGTPGASDKDTTVNKPAPEKPQAGTPPVVQPPPGAPAANRRNQPGGRTPAAGPTDDPGMAGRIDESTGPATGTRDRPPEDDSKPALPDHPRDSEKPGVSAPPESIR